jgi:ABC-type thiamin/hydroxymethylpyrimidine transport system permease subunit
MMILALLPAVALATALIFIVQWIAGPLVAVGLATLAAIAVLAGEIALGVWLLGGRFEKLDLSSELKP